MGQIVLWGGPNTLQPGQASFGYSSGNSGGGYGSGNPFAGLDMNALMQMFAPKTAPQRVNEMNQADTMLPSDIQESAAQIDPNAIATAEANYKRMYVNPQIAQIRANQAVNGRDNSTFGGAELGQAEAMGNLNAYYAGQDMVNQALQRWAQKRASYFGGEGGLTSPDNGAYNSIGALGNLAGANKSMMDSWLTMQNFMQSRNYMRNQMLFGLGGVAAPYAQQGFSWLWNHRPGKSGGGTAIGPDPYANPSYAPIGGGTGSYSQPFGGNAFGSPFQEE